MAKKTLSYSEKQQLILEKEKLKEGKKEVERVKTARRIETDPKKKAQLGSDLEKAIGDVAKIEARIKGLES